MILREATIKYSGVDPDLLTKGSHKRVCVSCDQCGRVRWVSFQKSYNNLCRSCAILGKNNGMYCEKITLTCKQCGEEFEVIPSRKNKKFCSHKCYGKWMSKNQIGDKSHNYKGGLITKFCEICGNEFEVYLSGKNHKFCSKGCCIKYQIGENASNWKGGFDTSRLYLIPKEQCIKLNSWFKGSEAHHLISGVIIYLPRDLHNRKYGISHDLKNNKNMKEINIKSLNYLLGDY